MLRITVEIISGGVGKPREVAQAVLGNISALADRSEYRFASRDNPRRDGRRGNHAAIPTTATMRLEWP